MPGEEKEGMGKRDFGSFVNSETVVSGVLSAKETEAAACWPLCVGEEGNMNTWEQYQEGFTKN